MNSLKSHIKAAQLLGIIKNEVLHFIRANPGTSELEVQQFILERFKKYKLVNEVAKPIVAFLQNTSFVHYYPANKTNKKLKAESLILIDIWSRLKSGGTYADLTWMAYYGKRVPAKIQRAFNTVLKARDKSLALIQKNIRRGILPTGKEIDSMARQFIENVGYRNKFRHGLGHELGTTSPHGRGSPISPRSRKRLKINMGYTIEPGVYFKNEFGIRSEVDFYITKRKKLIITTPIQRKLTII